MKIYDFDGMFDKKLSEYISKNAGKYKEEEWEDIIPRLYDKFGDAPIKSIGKSPRAFFAELSDEGLVGCLKSYLRSETPVPEFLCKEIEGRKIVPLLLPLLDGSPAEVDYAVNLISSDGRAISKYLDLLVSCGDEELKSRLADNIKEKADLVTERAIALYKEGKEREYMLDILSRTVVKSDEIFNILINEFRTDIDNIPMRAAFLAAYGDERALPYLLDKIDEEGISFIEYRELKFAIEALGGEYEKERDFSSDPYYSLIKGHDSNGGGTDIFSLFGKKI